MTDFKPKGWDELLKNDKNHWSQPYEFVDLLVSKLKSSFSNPIRVLDLGFGAGRHLKYLAENNFVVSGFDIAKNAESISREKFISHFSAIDLKTLDMHSIPWPYEPASFQGILSINVIHHTNYEGFLNTLDEISRILLPKGFFLATIASKENHKFGVGEQIDEYTYLTDSGAEKGIPHVFFQLKIYSVYVKINLIYFYLKKYVVKFLLMIPV